MAIKAKFGSKGKKHDSYMQLIAEFPLASIKSDEQLAAAQQAIDRLLVSDLDAGTATYLEALSDLVAVYEDEHHRIPSASDADMLRHFMEAKSVTRTELSRATGIAKSTLSEVLAGKKRFSRGMIRKLADYFHVDIGVLAGNL